jgi:quercetin dioxygenase-like cupin family protein
VDNSVIIMHMQLKKYRWAKTYEAGEHELEAFLTDHNIVAERWEAEPGEIIEPLVYPSDIRLWCGEGSIKFTIGAQTIPLQTGDTLHIPSNTMYSATAGFMGCVCYQNPTTNENPTVIT